MANRWGKIETVIDFILLGSKITADGDCSHEIKSWRNQEGLRSRTLPRPSLKDGWEIRGQRQLGKKALYWRSWLEWFRPKAILPRKENPHIFMTLWIANSTL